MLITPSEEWTRVSITRIEDLSDTVYGAGLEVTKVWTEE